MQSPMEIKIPLMIKSLGQRIICKISPTLSKFNEFGSHVNAFLELGPL